MKWFLYERLKNSNLDIKILDPPKHIDADVSIAIFNELKKKKDINEIVNKVLSYISDIIKSYVVERGYINVHLDWNKVIDKYPKLFYFPVRNKKIIIEHTSVNPNKAIHIGHIRNAILGDSINRLLKFLGYNVEIQNYIDNTGSQVADILVGILYFGFPENPEQINKNTIIDNIVKFVGKENSEKIVKIITEREDLLEKLYGYRIPKKIDHYFGDYVYVIVNKLYSEFPQLTNLQKDMLKKIEEKDEEVYRILLRVTRKILEAQLQTLWNLNIYYDLLVKESDILESGLWAEAFEALKKKGIIEYVKEGDKKGTWSIDLHRWEEFKGMADKYKVIVRSDGTTVYIAKDIAYAMWKHGLIENKFRYSLFTLQPNKKELWETNMAGELKDFGNADISINIIGNEQKYLQDIISKIIEEFSRGEKKYVFYGYGHVFLSKNTAKMFGIETEKNVYKMSGRKGIYINVDNFLKILEEKIKKLLSERNISENIEELAKKIARTSLAFEILKYDKNTNIIFDIDKMSKIEEGNALYVLYTYARLNSLLDKANVSENDIDGFIRISNFDSLQEYEKKLLRELFKFKDILLEVENTLKINTLADYLLKICYQFNEFYQNVPIIHEMGKYPHRIVLVLLTKKILDKLFYILKIDGVKRV